MAAPPARARADYDYLIKLLLIGDSGECLLLLLLDLSSLSPPAVVLVCAPCARARGNVCNLQEK
jgi:hypothetical protein